MSGPIYNAWKLTSLSPLPAWVLVALGLALLGGVVLAGIGLRKEPLRARRLLLWTLRILAAVAALLLLLEPGIRRLQVAQVKNRLAILVDRSASMGFPSEPNGVSRAQEVAEFLAHAGSSLDSLRERFTVELYGFDPELSPTSVEALRSEPPRAGTTNLMAALRSLKASDASGSKKLSGVLLFSDGADNTELASGLTGHAKRELADLGLPVSTFLAGRDGLLDLAVENIKVDDFAFVRNSITAEVELKSRGFAGQSIPVVLKREGQVVASRGVQLGSDGSATVPFTFTPDRTGRFVYTVSVPVYPGEAVTDNNARSFVLKVIRDRIRVLLVVGRPSWDERFLRGLLKQDANVDLVSFYILRTSTDDTKVLNQDRELSLIPFPMDEIFDSKLSTFDVVIFQNFGYTDPQLNIERYEPNLEQYVYNGGAFIEIGGDHAFGERHTDFRVLGKALPVEPSGQGVRVESFKPRLTPEGQRHPVTAIVPGVAQNEAAWAALPPLSGMNLTRARPGAVVLMENPFVTVDGKNAPVAALWEYGRGRALALTVDDSWVWAFTAKKAGASTRQYDRFWGNALRWLVRDPDLTTLQVSADPPSVEPGKPVGAQVTVRKASYEPAAGATVRVQLVDVETQKPVGTQQATAGADGVARVSFPPPKPGAYKLSAEATLAGQSLGTGEDAVAVRAVGPELADASVGADKLAQLARAGGGRAYQLPLSSLPEVPLLDPPVVEVGRSKDQPLWDRWYSLVVLALLLGGEWFARRRFGYV